MSSLGRPLAFDFSGEPPATEWLVEGLIERGTVTLLAGDSGAGKSLICQSLIVSLVHRKPWLGRATHGTHVLAIDEENAHSLVRRRLKALGLSNDDRGSVSYYCRNGIMLGDPQTTAAAIEEVAVLGADLIIVDTIGAASGIEVTDNSAVVRFYATTLRPLAELGGAVLILHHPRKPAAGQRPGPIKHDLMGAGQWRYQADAMLSLNAAGGMEVEAREDGTATERYPVTLEVVKMRDGVSGTKERLEIVSERDPAGKLRWLRVESQEADKRRQWAEQVERLVRDNGGSMSVGAVAEALGARAEDPALMRGLRSMEQAGSIRREGDVWRIADTLAV